MNRTLFQNGTADVLGDKGLVGAWGFEPQTPTVSRPSLVIPYTT